MYKRPLGYPSYQLRRPNPYTAPSSSSCSCPSGGIGSQLGATVGNFAEKGIRGLAKSWFGLGDYSLKSNSLIPGGGSITNDVQIVPAGPRETRIIYREYIGDVFTHPTTAGAFYARTYPLNPGLLSLCPWLAPIAQQYEQWTPNGIVFEFKSTSSEYVATQALGSVIMATEYDSLDAVFSNKQDMLNSAYSNEAKPSERIVHGIECDPRDNPLRVFYVRSGAVPSGGSIRDYDLGTFTVATQGGATANLNLGSLYVHYDLTFRKEQVFNGIPARGNLSMYYHLAGTINGTNPLGSSSPTVDSSSTLPSTDASVVINVLTFPTYTVGAQWRLVYLVVGGSVALALPTFNVSGGTLGTTNSSPAAGETSTLFMYVADITQTSPTCTFTIGVAGTLPTAAVGTLRFSQIPN